MPEKNEAFEEIEKHRAEIDAIDQKLVALLNERAVRWDDLRRERGNGNLCISGQLYCGAADLFLCGGMYPGRCGKKDWKDQKGDQGRTEKNHALVWLRSDAFRIIF